MNYNARSLYKNVPPRSGAGSTEDDSTLKYYITDVLPCFLTEMQMSRRKGSKNEFLNRA